jgi:hypothetical protein
MIFNLNYILSKFFSFFYKKETPIIPPGYQLMRPGDFIAEDCYVWGRGTRWTTPKPLQWYRLVRKGIWIAPINRTTIRPEVAIQITGDYIDVQLGDLMDTECLKWGRYARIDGSWEFCTEPVLITQSISHRYIKPINHKNTM